MIDYFFVFGMLTVGVALGLLLGMIASCITCCCYSKGESISNEKILIKEQNGINYTGLPIPEN